MRIAMPARWARRLLSEQITQASRPDSFDMPSPEELHNARLLRFEAPFTSIALGAIPSFLALFAIQLGASNAMVGWLTSGPALLNLFWLIPCGRLIQRARNYAYPLAVGALLQRVLLLALATVPFLPAAWRPWGVVGFATLSTLPSTLWGLSFHTASGELFSPQHLARLVGQRWAIANIATVIGMLLLGKMIDLIIFPLNFQVLLVGTGILTMTTVWLVLRLRFPPGGRAESGNVEARPTPRRAQSLWKRHRTFILYEAGTAVACLALFAATPLFRIYWVRDLKATGGWVGALTAAFSVGATLGSLLWGRWSHARRDRRNLLIGGCGVLAIYPLLTAAFNSLAPLLGVMALSGFFAGGYDLLLFNRTVRVTPRGQRPTFLAIHNIITNMAAFVGPLISTALVDQWGARVVLVIVSGLGLIGALLFYGLGWGKTADEEEGTAP